MAAASFFNNLQGDTGDIFDNAQGGDDTLIGGNNTGSGGSTNALKGQDGDDVLTGGNNSGSGWVDQRSH